MQMGRNDATENKALTHSPGTGPGWDAEPPPPKKLNVHFWMGQGCRVKVAHREICVNIKDRIHQTHVVW